MVASIELQTSYITLYKQMRKYIWDFDTVEALADLEVAVFKKFPASLELHSSLSKLKACIGSLIAEDEDLRTAIKSFDELVSESDHSMYSKLIQVREVVQ